MSLSFVLIGGRSEATGSDQSAATDVSVLHEYMFSFRRLEFVASQEH